MKKVLFFFCAAVFLCCAGGVFAEGYYQFIDGFSLQFKNSAFNINVVSTDPDGIENVIEVSTPSGGTVYGFIFYKDPREKGEIKGTIVNESRNLYIDDVSDVQNEMISLDHDFISDTIHSYWIYLLIGDSEYYLLGADLRESPGAAKAVIFAFPPFSELHAEARQAILEEIAGNIRIDFMEAAG